MKRFLSFTLIPHSPQEIHSRKIPLSLILFFVGSSLFFFVALGFFIRSHLATTVRNSDLKLQEGKTSSLREKVEKVEASIDGMENELAKLKELRSKMEESLPLQSRDLTPSAGLEERNFPHISLEEVRVKLFSLSEEVTFQRRSFQEILNVFKGDPQIPNHLPSILPSRGWIISGFGDRENPFTGRTEFHEGMDIASLPDSKILATGDGIVRSTGFRMDLGYFLVLDHGYSITTLYGHCSKLKARVGESVKRGETIAFIGTSGKTLGPCVHYEVRIKENPVDPLAYILESTEPVKEKPLQF